MASEPAYAPRMARSFQVTFDSADPESLAGFWAEALGYIMQPPPEGYDTWEAFADEVGIAAEDRDKLAAVIDPDGAGPRVLIQKVPETKTAKNRCHLDVNVTDRTMSDAERRLMIDAEAERLVDLGATELEKFDQPDGTWTVLQDPEGNEFCLQ